MELETKWEDTSTIINKVHRIPPLKATVDDKYSLWGCLTFMKIIHCLWQINDVISLHKYENVFSCINFTNVLRM